MTKEKKSMLADDNHPILILEYKVKCKIAQHFKTVDKQLLMRHTMELHWLYCLINEPKKYVIETQNYWVFYIIEKLCKEK